MRMVIQTTFFILLFLSQIVVGQTHPATRSAEPETFFRTFAGLSDDQIRDIREGKAVAKVLPTSTPDEVFVFGAVYVKSAPERYLKMTSDIDALRTVPGYLAVRSFSEPPSAADLGGFNLDDRDIHELQTCVPGHCEVQLPTEAMEEFQRSVDWRSPDRVERAQRVAQQMVLQALLRYQQGGDAALGSYRDKSRPTAVADAFASMLSHMKSLPAYLPEMERYLRDYPNAAPEGITSRFYWEKVHFGLKPTLRVVQTVVYRGTGPDRPDYVVAEKQIYASHYFETALELTGCLRDTESAQNGFYLVTIKGSQQAGLSGFKGSIVRKVAVDKTRASLQKALAAYKQRLETTSE